MCYVILKFDLMFAISSYSLNIDGLVYQLSNSFMTHSNHGVYLHLKESIAGDYCTAWRSLFVIHITCLLIPLEPIQCRSHYEAVVEEGFLLKHSCPEDNSDIDSDVNNVKEVFVSV